MSASLPANRSIPESVVIPVLSYADVGVAVEWLTRALGFVERLRIGAHRAQLSCGGGSIVVTDGATSSSEGGNHSVMVRVADIDSHFERARACGARVLAEPTDQPYGERQYSLLDPGGHAWTFTQTIADVDPRSWGGIPGPAM